MKKILALSAVATLCLSLGTEFASAAFSDVPSTHMNAEAIAYVQQKGIVQGYADGTFKADNSINRAELTKIIVGTLFKPEGANCFPDVKAQWFAPYVCAAKAHGIIGGYPDGTFKPEKNISFAEAAKIITLAFGREVPAQSEVWYEGFVRSLADANAIPTNITTFDKLLTRGDMAEMIFRLDSKNNDKPSKTYESFAGLPEGSETDSGATSLSIPRITIKDYPSDWVYKNITNTAFALPLPVDATFKVKNDGLITISPILVQAGAYKYSMLVDFHACVKGDVICPLHDVSDVWLSEDGKAMITMHVPLLDEGDQYVLHVDHGNGYIVNAWFAEDARTNMPAASITGTSTKDIAAKFMHHLKVMTD